MRLRTFVLDWTAVIREVLNDVRKRVPTSLISKKFHNALVSGIIEVAQQAGIGRVALSGGCFQNRYLTERTVRQLGRFGFQAYWHQRVPPNDGGISLGQVYAARQMEMKLRADRNELVEERDT